MPKQYTRKELHQMVWEQPMIKVAAKLNISDVALAKICKKNDIPRPQQGHWAKLAAGKPVLQAELPPPQEGQSNRIDIFGSHASKLPESVKVAHSKAQQCERNNQNPPAALPKAYLRFKERLSMARPKKDGFVRLQSTRDIPIAINFTSVERAIDLLEAIASDAARRGYEITQGKDSLLFLVDKEMIPMKMEELMDKVPHAASTKEVSQLEKWEQRYKSQMKLHGWASDWDKPKIPEFDLVPSGRLMIEIDHGSRYDGLRRKFKDGKTQKLEKLTEKVLTAVATCAAASIARREEALRQAEELKVRELNRKERDRINTLEKKRWEYFQVIMNAFNEARRMDAQIAHYREYFSDHEHLSDCEDLLQWASIRTKRASAISDPKTVANTLTKYRLMENDTKIDAWAQIEHQESL